VLALQFPGLEKWRPVDVAGELGEVVAAESTRTEKGWLRRHVSLPIELELVGARVGNRGTRLLRPSPRVRLRHARIVLAHARNCLSPLLRSNQVRPHADGAACVRHVDRLAPRIVWADLYRGVYLARGGAADEQRQIEAFALHLCRDMAHFIERWRNQAREADDVDFPLFCGIQDLLRRHHDTK